MIPMRPECSGWWAGVLLASLLLATGGVRAQDAHFGAEEAHFSTEEERVGQILQLADQRLAVMPAVAFSPLPWAWPMSRCDISSSCRPSGLAHALRQGSPDAARSAAGEGGERLAGTCDSLG